MKLVAALARSLQADIKVELRTIERAVTTGTRDAGRGLKTELRRQVGRPVSASGSPTAGATSTTRTRGSTPRAWSTRRRRRSSAPSTRVLDSEQARALSRDPDRERTEEGHRRQADQAEHLPGAPLRPLRFVPRSSGPSLLVVDGSRASFSRKPESCEASGVQPIGPGTGPGSDHGGDVPARAAGEAARSGSMSRGRPSAGRRSCRR